MNTFNVITDEDEVLDFLNQNKATKILQRFDEVKTDCFAFFKTIKTNCCVIKAAHEEDSGLILIMNEDEKSMTNYAIELLKTQGLDKDKLVWEKL